MTRLENLHPKPSQFPAKVFRTRPIQRESNDRIERFAKFLKVEKIETIIWNFNEWMVRRFERSNPARSYRNI